MLRSYWISRAIRQRLLGGNGDHSRRTAAEAAARAAEVVAKEAVAKEEAEEGAAGPVAPLARFFTLPGNKRSAPIAVAKKRTKAAVAAEACTFDLSRFFSKQ